MTGMLQRLLVATDGTPACDRVVAFAIALARKRGGEMLLCYAIDHARAIVQSSATSTGFSMGMQLVEALDDAARSILADAAKRAQDAGIPVTTIVLEGRSAQAIVTCANERHVDAIVMGTQAKAGLDRFFLGSTAEAVLRRTDVPTFVLPPTLTGGDVDFDRIVVGVDDSDPSDAAAAFAIDLAYVSASKLTFCAAIQTANLLEEAAANGYDRMSMLDEFRKSAAATLAAQAECANARGVDAKTLILEGDPTEMILKATETHNAGLIVLGTHGHRGLRRFLLGSVAEGVVRASPVPVVVLRASHLRATMDIAS